MGTKCAPLIADLFSFCYERDFMLSLSEDNQSDVIEAFNSSCCPFRRIINLTLLKLSVLLLGIWMTY